MFEEMQRPDPPLTKEEKIRVGQISKIDANEIDQVLLSNVDARWRKVARIVGDTMATVPFRFHDLPDVFFAQRLRFHVAQGRLEYRGYLPNMRFCEIRSLVEKGKQ